MLKSIIYGNVYGGAAVRGLKRMLGCIMAVMTILGGNGVMVKAGGHYNGEDYAYNRYTAKQPDRRFL